MEDASSYRFRPGKDLTTSLHPPLNEAFLDTDIQAQTSTE